VTMVEVVVLARSLALLLVWSLSELWSHGKGLMLRFSEVVRCERKLASHTYVSTKTRVNARNICPHTRTMIDRGFRCSMSSGSSILSCRPNKDFRATMISSQVQYVEW
jgi:hypothetical protein